MTERRHTARQQGATVTLSRLEYERLLAKAGESETGDGPAFPRPDAQGNLPAVEFIRVSIAREVTRRRRAAGLSQVALAKLANVRQTTISNIERAKHTVNHGVMQRIERAFSRYERRSAQNRSRRSA